MSLPQPNLDDKTFAALVAEATKLIPRHAPDWTDHNRHDPGITFVELFSWLAEMQQFYLNRVGDESYIKFQKTARTPPTRGDTGIDGSDFLRRNDGRRVGAAR